ncbi:MAG: LptE family protein [Bacteroidales bacterium]
MKTLRWINLLLIGFCFALFSTSCGVYSFTGASIPTQAKTMYVAYFKNRAPTVQPLLSSTFSTKLQEYLVSQSNLSSVQGTADLEFAGEIIGYNIVPTSIQGNDKAALNRLTITVQVRYINRFDKKFSFNQSFSRYQDFNANINLTPSVEQGLIDDITTQLVEDIYQRAFVNW